MALSVLGTAVWASPAHPALQDGAVQDPEVMQLAPAQVPADPGARFLEDLPAIQGRGVLRVLVQGQGEQLLPRDGASSREDRELLDDFAHAQRLQVEIVPVRAFEELIPALREGRGDVIAGRLTVTAARKRAIAFTRPYRVVQEILIGRHGSPAATDLGHAALLLRGQPVAVLAGSAHEETVDDLHAPGLSLLRVNDHRDEHDLAMAVGRGELAATVMDSDVLPHVRAYNPDVVPWFPLRSGRELAIGVRTDNPLLKAALDAFLMERALNTGRARPQRHDLAGLKERGSIRVLTKNDDVSYFLNKGVPRGFDHDLLALFAKAHRLRLDLVVPPDPNDICAWLREGRGDVAAALLPAPGCGMGTMASPPYVVPDLLVVRPASPARRAGSAPGNKEGLHGLRGRTVHAHPGLAAHIKAALATRAAELGLVVVDDAPDDVSVRVDAVASGVLPAALLSSADRGVLVGRADVVADIVVSRDVARVLATRDDAPALAQALAEFVRGHVQLTDEERTTGSTDYNLVRRAYLTMPTRPRVGASGPPAVRARALSPYDVFFQSEAARTGLDWRLLAAQAYQESRFDPHAVSDAGAVGLFQVMPATGRELGFVDLRDPRQATAAAARYMAWLIDQFEPHIPFKHRVRFALASYNAGKGHVDDARRLARAMGLNPDKWFKNVELAMLQLADPKVARTTRYGYCRGSEAVAYVSEITTRYENYTATLRSSGHATSR